MSARFLIGDVHERLRDIPDHTVDLVLTSPPFLALRSYLPDDHPDKHKEIGSEDTPAEFIDVMLRLTAEWDRVLARHGSIAVELGDTYSGAGGYGDPDSPNPAYGNSDRFGERWEGRTEKRFKRKNDGWPEAKSLACIPQLYQVALAYGINPLTGSESPAGRWRVRTLKPWIRSNPPVGALGDKERPATSYVIVACRASDRWFDLDAVRTAGTEPGAVKRRTKDHSAANPSTGWATDNAEIHQNSAGAPPRDWWHHVDAILDAELARRRERPPTHARTKGTQDRSGKSAERGGNWGSLPEVEQLDSDNTTGAQGVHLRRALERAGILTTREALDVSPKGYSGAHYAVWPPELVRLLVDEMCPRRVCTTCGEPSRRIVDVEYEALSGAPKSRAGRIHESPQVAIHEARRITTPLSWSDCGCLPQSPVGGATESGEAGSTRSTDHTEPWPPTSPTPGHWRPGHVLDPFAGSGTTLAVCTGMGRDVTGIDIDERNADLARGRVGMFLTVDHPTREATA